MAIKEAIDWESAMAGVERTNRRTGESSESAAAGLKLLEEQLRAVAAASPTPSGNIAQIAEEAGALGIARENVAKFTETFDKLMNTTDITAADLANFARIAGVMQVPEEGFENLASSILEVGRSTAATEPEILNMARRLSGAASAAGLTADQLIGLSAAVISLGPRAEAGATAVSKTFRDMSAAIIEGGEKLQIFQQLFAAGGGRGNFVEVFRRDAAEAFTSVIEGLDTLGRSGQATDAILANLGITETRQVQALQQMAATSHSTTNENLQLRKVLQTSATAWAQNTALAEIAERRYATVAAQLGQLRNRFLEIANTIGKVFIGPIKVAIGIAEDFAAGFKVLPGPVQAVVASLIAFVGLVTGLAAAVLLVLPRIVLARQSLNSLRDAALGVNGALAATDASMAATGLAAEGMATAVSGAMIQLRNAQGQFAGQVAANTAAIGQMNAATAATTATAGSGGRALGALSTGLGTVGKAAGVAGILLAAIGPIITSIGVRAEHTKKKVQELEKADATLTDKIREQARGLSQAADEWVINELVMSDAVDTIKRLNINYGLLLDLIKGTGDAAANQALFEQLVAAEKAGDKGASKLLDVLDSLFQKFKASAVAAGQYKRALGQAGIAADDLTDSVEGATGALDANTEALNKRARASIDLIGALFAQRAAEFALKDAQEQYNEAVERAADPTLAREKAEISLQRAEQDRLRSIQDVADAEEALATARQRQAEDVLAAEDNLLDARDAYADSLLKIEDLERGLEELRAGPTLDQLRDAINKLADAQLDLIDADQAVLDTEWNLQHLREEGASTRDLQDAERKLARARQKQSEQLGVISDAEEDLQKLRDSPTPDELQKAERDLAAARRDSQRSLLDITTKERELTKARLDAANDTFFKEAERDLAAARLQSSAATIAVRDAQFDLNKVLREDPSKDVAKAAFELEQAYVNMAKANVEVQRQSALSRGEMFDERREAAALADELDRIGRFAPDDVRARFKQFTEILRQTLSDAAAEARIAGLKIGDAAGSGVEEGLRRRRKNIENQEPPFWQRLGDQLGSIISLAITGAIVGFFLGGPVGAVIGAAIGALIPIFIEFGGDIIEGIREGIGRMGAWLEKQVSDFFDRWLINPFRHQFKLFSPSQLFADFGANIIIGLVQGIFSKNGLLGQIPGFIFSTVTRGFGNAGQWLLSAGSNLVIGLYNGVVQWSSNLFSRLDGIWNGITRSAGRLYNDFVGIGTDLLIGLWNGIADWSGNFFAKAGDFFGGVVDWVNGFFGNHSPSKVFAGIGVNLIKGLALGITTEGDRAIDAVRDVVEQMQNTLESTTLQADFVTRASASNGAFAARPAAIGATTPPATVVNEGHTFHIEDVQKADAMDIAHDVVWLGGLRKR